MIAKNQNGSVIGINIYPFQEPEELSHILETDIFLNTPHEENRLFVFNQNFCLVPGMLFDPKQLKTYLQFSSPIDDHKVFYDGLENNKILLIGSMEKAIFRLLSKKLPNLHPSHGSLLVMEYLLQERGEMLNQEISIVIEQNQVYIAGFANKELKLFNRFEVYNNQDFLKYTFSVLHQLAFDRMHCKITLLGNLEDIGVQEEILGQYFKNLVINSPRTNQNYLIGAEAFKETQNLAAFWTV
ncbi:hypothetical protein GCM10028791_35170 [Echinicola sediminis]